MKSLVLFFSLLSIVSVGSAQNNLQLHYGYRGSLSGSKFFPSTLNLNHDKFQVGLNFKVWVANKSLAYGSIHEIQKNGKLSESDVNKYIRELDAQNILGVGQDFLILGLAFRKRIKSKKVDFSIAIRDRMSASFRYPKELLQLAWQGNKQFEGQRINLATSLDARYFREYSLGSAFDLVSNAAYRVRVGATLKYYQGLAAIYMPSNQLYFETGMEGDFLELDYNYNVQLSGVGDFSFFRQNGIGWGANLGATFAYKERWFLDLSLCDIGYIKYKNNVQTFHGSETIRYSGLNRSDLNDIDNYEDSISNIFENDILEGGSFKMPIGARLFVQLLYKLKSDKSDSNPSNVYITLVKGFDELPGVTKQARISAGYNRRVLRWLYLGVSSSYGGFNDFAIGALASARVKKYRFGFHSDDFTGAVFPSLGTGAGFGFVVQRYF